MSKFSIYPKVSISASVISFSTSLRDSLTPLVMFLAFWPYQTIRIAFQHRHEPCTSPCDSSAVICDWVLVWVCFWPRKLLALLYKWLGRKMWASREERASSAWDFCPSTKTFSPTPMFVEDAGCMNQRPLSAPFPTLVTGAFFFPACSSLCSAFRVVGMLNSSSVIPGGGW